mmetsp:Transcript_18610/g.55629  ORF Transcript_18610/g.55629 Transcript_18610/m.55629 type:complete len:248 (+) Transcript_18610:162-905(+)
MTWGDSSASASARLRRRTRSRCVCCDSRRRRAPRTSRAPPTWASSSCTSTALGWTTRRPRRRGPATTDWTTRRRPTRSSSRAPSCGRRATQAPPSSRAPSPSSTNCRCTSTVMGPTAAATTGTRAHRRLPTLASSRSCSCARRRPPRPTLCAVPSLWGMWPAMTFGRRARRARPTARGTTVARMRRRPTSGSTPGLCCNAPRPPAPALLPSRRRSWSCPGTNFEKGRRARAITCRGSTPVPAASMTL